MRQMVNRAVRENSAARKALKRMIEECPPPGSQLYSLLTARIAIGLGNNLEALIEIETIIRDAAANGSQPAADE